MCVCDQNAFHLLETILSRAGCGHAWETAGGARWQMVWEPGPRWEGASERRQAAARSSSRLARWRRLLSEAPGSRQAQGAVLSAPRARPRREDSWPSSCSPNWLESALTPRSAAQWVGICFCSSHSPTPSTPPPSLSPPQQPYLVS